MVNKRADMTGTEPLISLIDVSFNHKLKRGTLIPIFEDLNLDVKYAEFLGIVGPSGSGKSTLLRLMAGLIKPDKGKVIFKGRELKGPDPKISLVHQMPALLPWMTVWDNVYLGIVAQKGIPEEEKRERVARLLDLVGLTGFDLAYPSELSGGMRQRVAIARALVNDPDLLLMDEPFSNLDPLTAINLSKEIEMMWLNISLPPASVVLVSHNVEEVVQLADRVVVLKGRPAEVVAILDIELDRPRNRKSEEFYRYTDEILTVLSS